MVAPRREPPTHVTDPVKCWGKSKARKEQCRKDPLAGSHYCRFHAGNGQARAKAAMVAEVARWTLGSDDVDPAHTLLQLLAQSKIRVDDYATRLVQFVDEHGGDLAAAMVDEQLVMSETGALQKVGEYIRGLATLEANERDRCAKFASLALQAGVAERQVRLAEQHGAMMATVLRMALGDPELALSAEQRAAIPAVMRRHLELLPAG